MIDFIIADFMQGVSSFATTWWAEAELAIDFCQGVFNTTFSPAFQQYFQGSITNVPNFAENISSAVNDRMAFNNNVDLGGLG